MRKILFLALAVTALTCGAQSIEQRRAELMRDDAKRIEKVEKERSERHAKIFKENRKKAMELIKKVNKYMSEPLSKTEMNEVADSLAQLSPEKFYDLENIVRYVYNQRAPGQFIDEVVMGSARTGRGIYLNNVSIDRRLNVTKTYENKWDQYR